MALQNINIDINSGIELINLIKQTLESVYHRSIALSNWSY